jgi:pyruvate kinase
MEELRALVGDKARLMAKIERPQAVSNLESIASASDAVLVARGDLGVEFPFEHVPLVQREVWERCMSLGVPVVCATEMLESMIVSSRPTRAEATDVAQAVSDTFDAVMLSAETAVGHDPVGAVSAMSRIRSQVELSSRFTQRLGRQSAYQTHDPRTSAIAAAAEQLARSVEAAAIIALTSSGATASTLSACRPSAPIISFTSSPQVARQLSLLWGVTALLSEKPTTLETAASSACRAAVEAGLVKSGDLVVVCGSRVGPAADADAIWVQHA